MLRPALARNSFIGYKSSFTGYKSSFIGYKSSRAGSHVPLPRASPASWRALWWVGAISSQAPTPVGRGEKKKVKKSNGKRGKNGEKKGELGEHTPSLNPQPPPAASLQGGGAAASCQSPPPPTPPPRMRAAPSLCLPSLVRRRWLLLDHVPGVGAGVADGGAQASFAVPSRSGDAAAGRGEDGAGAVREAEEGGRARVRAAAAAAPDTSAGGEA